MVLDVIFDYIGKTFQQLYSLLTNVGLTAVVGASPFWIIVSIMVTTSIIGIMCRLNVGLFSEVNGGR